jgi:hypothetical protein
MRVHPSFSSLSLALLLAGSAVSLAACSSDSQGSDSDIPPAAGGLGLGGAAGVAGSAGVGAGGTAGSAGLAGKGGAGTGGQTAGGASGTAGAGGSSSAGAAGQGGAGTGGAGTGGVAQGGAGAGAAGEGGAGGGGQAGSGDAGAGGVEAGGAGQAGAGGAGAGGAGGASDCLDPAEYADALDVDPSLCVVRAYQTGIESFGFSLQMTWGRQNGPLTTIGGSDKALIQRWDLPASPTGTLTAPTGTDLKVPGVATGIFWGPAFDLPYLDFSAIAYTGSAAPTFPGELVALDGAFLTVKSRASVNGFYSAVGYESGGAQRLLYTGLSGLTDKPSDTASGGVYGSSLCAGQLAPTADCTPSAKLGSWAPSSGPVARDSAGNVAVALSNPGGKQEIHLFAPGAIEAGESGDVYTDGNFTTSLATVAPSGSGAGWLFAQETDGATFSALSLQATRYDAAPAGGVKFQATTSSVLATKAAGANPIVVTGNDGLVWIATDTPAKGGMFFAFKPR